MDQRLSGIGKRTRSLQLGQAGGWLKHLVDTQQHPIRASDARSNELRFVQPLPIGVCSLKAGLATKINSAGVDWNTFHDLSGVRL